MANYLHCVIILSFLGSLLQIVLLGNNIFSFHHLSLAITLYHAVSSRQICVQVSEVLHQFHFRCNLVYKVFSKYSLSGTLIFYTFSSWNPYKTLGQK